MWSESQQPKKNHIYMVTGYHSTYMNPKSQYMQDTITISKSQQVSETVESDSRMPQILEILDREYEITTMFEGIKEFIRIISEE